MIDSTPGYCKKEVVIFGCGNILFGDDGFGPEVVKYLEQHYTIPENVCIIDVGTSIRGILFNILLSEIKPQKIVIIDAVDLKREPGEIFDLSIDEMPINKIDDFSLHLMPSTNMLKELKEFCNIEVFILSCQVQKIPEEMYMGLTLVLKESVKQSAEIIKKRYFDIF